MLGFSLVNFIFCSRKAWIRVINAAQIRDRLILFACRNPDVLCLQLHGRLQVEEQRRIFEPSEQRKVVFATNCAETSITVPGTELSSA
jgi:HrpA-like RNA helicase